MILSWLVELIFSTSGQGRFPSRDDTGTVLMMMGQEDAKPGEVGLSLNRTEERTS